MMAKAFNAGFQRIVHRVLPVPVGSRDRVTRYRHFSAACSLGKCPRALTARRMRALTDSIALVVQTMRRISVSKRRNGVNSSYAFSQSRTIAGYFLPHASTNSANRSSAASSAAAV